MNTPVLEATKEETAAKLKEYKASRHFSDPEYQQIIAAYEWLAKGHKLIDVGDAIREAGFDDQMRPKLAIARADRRTVAFHWHNGTDTARFDSNASRGRQFSQYVERVNFNQRPGRWIDAYAIVPLMPANIHPARPQDHHILWEVEKWHEEPIGATASPDPYLLRRVRGDLFAIIAEWDLTPIELMVCQGRALRRG